MNFALALSCVVAGVGVAAGIVAGHRGPDASGNLRIVPDSVTTATVPPGSTADWLDTARRDLAIRPDQSVAWQTYVNDLTGLETSRIALERERTAGTVQDIESERGHHALALASALSGLERHLSPEQRTKARLLTQVLANTVICRELADR